MADTIREQIIQDFVIRAGAVTGYSAVRARTPVSESDVPCINIIPGREQAELKYNLVTATFSITIEAMQYVDLDQASTIQEDMLGDLLTAFTDPEDPVSGLTDYIKYSEGGPAGVTQAKEMIAGVAIVVDVKYTYLAGNPYRQ